MDCDDPCEERILGHAMAGLSPAPRDGLGEIYFAVRLRLPALPQIADTATGLQRKGILECHLEPSFSSS